MMDRTPRAQTVRQFSAAAYLPVVAVVLLSQRKYRDIRLIRFHCYQAIGVTILTIVLLFFGSVFATVFGSLPGIGLMINLLVGLEIVGTLLGATVISFYGAAMGYQGNYTHVPLLTDWVWQQVNGGHQAGSPPPPRRRRPRPRPEDDIDWDEIPIPAQLDEERS